MSEVLDAVLCCNLSRIKMLVKNTEEVDIPISDSGGLTLLHLSAGVQSSEGGAVVSYLLNCGASPNIRTDDGLTPVHIAAMWNNCDVLKKLLTFGGNPWLCDSDNKNAMDLAIEAGAHDCFKLLTSLKMKQTFDNACDQQWILKNISTYDESSTDCDSRSLISSVDSTSSSDDSKTIANYFKNLALKNRSQQYLENSHKSSGNCQFSICNSDTKSWCVQDLKSSNLKNVKPETIDQVFFSDSDNSDTFKNTSLQTSTASRSSVKKSLNMFCGDKSEFLYSNSSDEGISNVRLYNKVVPENNIVVEITHTDEEEGVIFIEQQCLSAASGTVTSDICNSSCSFKSDWKSYQTAYQFLSSSSESLSGLHAPINIPENLLKLSNSEIFQKLKELGDDPGPVLDVTRQIYLRRLAKLKMGSISACSPSQPKYPSEIYLFLDDKLDKTKLQQLDQEISDDFDQAALNGKLQTGSSQRWSFIYFLLDPRVTKNLPARSSLLTYKEKFTIFIDSLFYVGKGTGGRPYSHLNEAARAIASHQNECNAKVLHILDIWRSGFGVVSLHCFQNCFTVEALTKEACIIEAVGLWNLTNIKKGSFYGKAAKLTMSRRRQVGVLLLSHALDIFLLEGERLIRLKDVK